VILYIYIYRVIAAAGTNRVQHIGNYNTSLMMLHETTVDNVSFLFQRHVLPENTPGTQCSEEPSGLVVRDFLLAGSPSSNQQCHK